MALHCQFFRLANTLRRRHVGTQTHTHTQVRLACFRSVL